MAHDIVMAAAGVSTGAAEYVEDVFSTWLYTGNGGAQTINNGIALGDAFDIQPGTALAGGFFAGFISDVGSGAATHALIVAPKASGQASSRQWKTSSSNTSGTSSDIDGPTNSSSMNNASHPAAQFCEGLTIGGFSDWYMPARNELEVCYFNLKPTTTSNNTSSGTNTNAVPSRGSNYTSGTPARTSASVFQSGGAEAFDATFYWSSSQDTANTQYAWFQNFDAGTQASSFKDDFGRVRAVRRIAISDSALDPYRVTGKGGLVWIKHRSGGGITPEDHVLYDTLRGVGNYIRTNSTGAEATGSNSLTAFNSNGFGLGADSTDKVNRSTALYASWTFRRAPKFFDVVTFTIGSGELNFPGKTISHSLGSTPGMIIVKQTNGTQSWLVAHRSTPNPYVDTLYLNSTAAAASNNLDINNVTSTTFNVFSGVGTYVAYLFAHNAGGFGDAGTDNIISCGGFTSDGSGNATVNLGYEPQWLLLKAAGTTQNWFVVDTMRGYSQTNWNFLNPNTSGAETTYTPVGYAPNATGFFLGPDVCFANTSYIYMAIRRPMKKPTSGTQVFSPVAMASAGPIDRFTNNFAADGVFYGNRGSTFFKRFVSRLTGNGFMSTPYTDAESTTGAYWDSNTTFGFDSGAGYDLIQHAFRRAPGFFDVVCYTGTGSNRTVTHNLGVAPELMIVKRRNAAAGWIIYHANLGNTDYVSFDTNPTQSASTVWNNTSPTSSVFTLGTANAVNSSGNTFVAYLFTTLAGVSKVGSYTGNGSSQTINCGFTNGARFVMIKRTDSSGDWNVYDSARGIVGGNDPVVRFNRIDGETSSDEVDPASSGFIVNADGASSVNQSGANYIYLAIA